jgi:EpsI family protein
MSPERASFTGTSTVLRLVVVAVALTAAALYLAKASRAEEVPPRESLAGLPMTFDGWNGRREPDLTPEILAVLGADDYTIRTYARDVATAVGLYIGYHASQRQGDTIHSPLNCLPGAGWQPMEQGRTVMSVKMTPDAPAATPIEINRVIIQKGLDRQLVFYWYQSHRRVVASEYWGKVYTVLDSVRYARTDAALVRVIAPIPASGTEAAEKTAGAFVQSLFPLLARHLPT